MWFPAINCALRRCDVHLVWVTRSVTECPSFKIRTHLWGFKRLSWYLGCLFTFYWRHSHLIVGDFSISSIRMYVHIETRNFMRLQIDENNSAMLISRIAPARVQDPDGYGVPETAGDADRVVGGRQLWPGPQFPRKGRMRRDLGEDMLGKFDEVIYIARHSFRLGIDSGWGGYFFTRVVFDFSGFSPIHKDWGIKNDTLPLLNDPWPPQLTTHT